MSTSDNLNDNPELGGAQLTPAGGEATVDSPDTLTLADLNTILGKDFKDKATALKSLKDTQSFVGKKQEDAVEAAKAALAANAPAAPDTASKSELQQLATRLFYSENPQYKGHEALINSMGGNPAEVVESDAFKNVFEKLKAADEVVQSKSVVSSSSRLATPPSVTETAVQVANARGSNVQDVAMVLAKAVNAEISENGG